MHISCNMGISVERKSCICMPKDSRQRFRIHSACKSVGGERLPIFLTIPSPFGLRFDMLSRPFLSTTQYHMILRISRQIYRKFE